LVGKVLIDASIDGHDPESDHQFSAGYKFDLKPHSLALLFRGRKPGDAHQARQEVNRRAEEDIVDSAGRSPLSAFRQPVVAHGREDECLFRLMVGPDRR
jgi:hypothetical protein